MGRVNRTEINVVKLPIPNDAPFNFSNGAVCLRMSSEWFHLLIGWIGYLYIRGAWENKTDEQWTQIKRWLDELMAIDVDCPIPPAPIPPAPIPPAPIPPGLSSAGTFGLSIEELEELLMSTIMGIRWNAGKLQVQYFPCCTWMDVESDSNGIIQFTGDKPVSDMTFGDWVQAEFPALPPVPVVPVQNPAYITADSVRCAKSTALANLLKDTFELIANAMITAGGLTSFELTTIAGSLVAGGITAGWATIIAGALVAAAALIDVSLADMADQYNDWVADVNIWPSYICLLSGAVIPGEKIDDTDINQMYYYWLIANGLPQDHWSKSIFWCFPAMYWKQLGQQDVATTDCGCPDLLPVGVQPAVPAGSLRIDALALYKVSTGDVTIDNPSAGEELNGIYTPSGGNGSLSGQYPRTTFMIDSSGHNWTALGCIYAASSPFRLDAASITLVPDQIASRCSIRIFAYTEADGWQTWATIDAEALPPANEYSFDGTNTIDVTHLALVVRADRDNEQPVPNYRVVSLRFTGELDGNGFSELEVGEVFTP